MLRSRIALSGMLVFAILIPAAGAAEGVIAPKVFGGARVADVYRIRVDRGQPLLESINAAIKEQNIQDGIVLTGVGTVQDCTYDSVKSLDSSVKDEVIHLKGAHELVGLEGLIAAGEPHIHITLSHFQTGAVGGHLVNGCQVYRCVEVTIVKLSGTPLARERGGLKPK